MLALRRLSALPAVAVVACASIGWFGSHGGLRPAAAAPLSPRVVYVGLSKNLRGSIQSAVIDRYKCKDGSVVRPMLAVKAALNMQVTSNGNPCDERATVLNGNFSVTWQIVVRDEASNSFGTHDTIGTFTWSDGANKVQGEMHGTIACGTHRLPIKDCERCRAPRHFEGLLTGKYVSGQIFQQTNGLAKLQASYAGELTGTDYTKLTAAIMTLDGVHILPCAQ